MLKSTKSRADEKFTASTKKSAQFLVEIEHERQLKARHTEKLRALRLEKEAAAEKPSARKKMRPASP